MKYPITPEYLQKAPENLVSIYSALEENILLYLCEQFKTGKLNATAVEMIRTLQRRGIDLSEIEKRIKAAAKLSDAEFDNVISEAVNFNRQYYNETLDKLGLIGDTYRADALALETQIIAEQTKGLFENITQSLGFAVRGADGKVQFLDIAKTYQRVLDIAEMQVQSGAFGYEEAIRGAVRTLSDSGLQWIEYSTGWHNRVDVAVRRAVMTGITQISAKYSDNLCEEVNTPYIEVTAHRGARDVPGKTPWASHKAWQGKVYSRNASDIYPSVYAVCGLGEVDGLCGINCRHGYHAWIEGVSERTYTDEELANIDKPPFEFEGKTYSAYEATQKQRQIEASMRTVKRRMEASKAAGLEDDYTDYSIRYRRLDEEYRKFSKAAGLSTQKQRISDYSPKNNKNRLYNSQESNIINTQFNTRDDPMAEVTGAAEVSNPTEIAQFEKEIEESGVRLVRNDYEDLAYSQGLVQGQPGVLHISKNASFSAWCHEMQHMRDDKAAGWSGCSIFADRAKYYERERRAYAVEIKLAKEAGRLDIVKQLRRLRNQERKRIYGDYDRPTEDD